ncbi:MAG: hypothetical protein Q9216_007071 [Gyalolechia sp. 2 TL-2023]
MGSPLFTMQDWLHLELFRRKYLQMVDPVELPYPSGDLIKPLMVQEWLCEKLFNTNRCQHLPNTRYVFRVMKKLLHTLEKAMEDPDKDEIIDEFMDRFTEVLGKSKQDEISEVQEKCAVTYTVPVIEEIPRTITIMEAPFLLSSGGDSGNRTWAAALHLATYLFTDGRHFVEGKSVLELGAGLGFLSILCGKCLGARHVLMTDGSEAVIDLAQGNVELNAVGSVVETSILKWGDSRIDKVLIEESGMVSYDLVLGADILYDPQDFPALVTTIRDMFDRCPRLQILMSSAIRTQSTLDSFLEACSDNKFQVERLDIPIVPEREQVGFFYSTFESIHVYLITSVLHREEDTPGTFGCRLA